MSHLFYNCCTKERTRVLGAVKASELQNQDDLWYTWDHTYCMGGEL
jgi:hypothetical protein